MGVNTSGLRKGGGRPKGLPNRATRAFKDRARELLEDPDLKAKHQRHVARYPDGSLSMFLYGHAYGRPKDTVEHTGGISIRWSDD